VGGPGARLPEVLLLDGRAPVRDGYALDVPGVRRQVQGGVMQVRGVSKLTVTLKRPLAAENSTQYQKEERREHFNAVALPSGRYLTPLACLVTRGWLLKGLQVEGAEAVVLATDGDLALLEGPLADEARRVPSVGHRHPAVIEMANPHYRGDEVVQRQVKWPRFGAYVSAKVRHEEVGSGLYAEDGALWGVIGWENGLVIEGQQIRAFLESVSETI